MGLCMKISDITCFKFKIIAYFTGAFIVSWAIIFTIYYKMYGSMIPSYEQGWLMPFLFMYIAQFPIIFGGQVADKVLLSKICGFSFVYVVYLCCVSYKLTHPVNGASGPLLIFGTIMLLAMPIIYAIGWGIGLMIFLLKDKKKAD